ncbi:NADPH:quinone reductase-like Zn-dependent oxidoreductase [Nocardia tenerifensis]|uniref:NADPH:quinone reductase-like Zn-dependent oxidoreductase n=1 Tax=Nocardia tenerifensis TaxID=228006 RepID=A0A318KAA6_9NOCA|nr:NAD(P)-dependent alcohol dehydrogenase [Nocardia tenerifensis]PXX68436.1 NADPH:quinone reductase-like Zn-dependent oxidoreductase [Nocardia tenerifensis]
MSEAHSPQSTVEINTMKAVVAPRYGTGAALRTEVVGRPAPGPGEVLVRVRAASVCQGDVHLLTGTPYLLRLGFGLRRPKDPIIGHDLAGEVAAVGSEVTEFRSGDAVFGSVNAGAFAEYVCVQEQRLAHAPTGLSLEEAAALPDSGMTALQGLRDVGGLRAGQRVLVNGASGGVGSAAVQLAKALGADVTAVCSTRHIGVMRALGADDVIDYTATDFTATGHRYDVLLDLVGNRSIRDCRRILAPNGVFVSSAGAPGGNWLGPIVWMSKVLLATLFSAPKLAILLMRPRRADLEYLSGLAADGRLRPLIERRYPLDRADEAVQHVLDGHAQGKTVLVV